MIQDKVIMLLIICGILFLFRLTFYFHRRKMIERKNAIYSQEWNTIKCKEKQQGVLDGLHDAYCYNEKANGYIDDITWKDLEMDGVFAQINNTYTGMGEIYLYTLLREPVDNEEVLICRDKIIEVFAQNEYIRNEKRRLLEKIGNRSHFSLYEYMDICGEINVSTCSSILCVMAICVSVLVCFFSFYIGVGLAFISVVGSILIYSKKRILLEQYVPFINQIASMINICTELGKETKVFILDAYLKKIRLEKNIRDRYRGISQIINFRIGNKTSEFDILFEYIRSLFHVDIFAFKAFNKRIKGDYFLLKECYETIGFLDAMMSIAYFRNQLKLRDEEYCKPDFEGTMLEGEGVFNPLIAGCVKNNYCFGRSVLITGSNATGKSTFLRTVAINTILAQTIYTVCATFYRAPFFDIMTSMSISDNIYSNDSYFMAEIKSIKRILDRKDTSKRMLCCIDEILKGTNTVERIGASAEILMKLAKNNAICIVSSHDVELSLLLQNSYEDYHFQEKITETGLDCDYLMYKGVTKSKNAIELLRLLGFSCDIVKRAKGRVNDFLVNGEWRA